jgi:hypothetical protein
MCAALCYLDRVRNTLRTRKFSEELVDGQIARKKNAHLPQKKGAQGRMSEIYIRFREQAESIPLRRVCIR